MNLQRWRTFLTIVSEGSFSAAAEKLGISQPAVSMQIQALEEELGVSLFDRSSRDLRLTARGELFRQGAERTLQAYEQTRSAVRHGSGTIVGPVRLGASTVPSEHLVPKLLTAFCQRHPHVEVRVQVADSHEIIERVQHGRLAAGIVGVRPHHAALASQPFGRDEIVLVVPPVHHLAGQEKVPIDVWRQEPFIIRSRGSGTREAIEQHLHRHQLVLEDLDVRAEMGSTDAVLAAVEEGLGVSLVSACAARRSTALQESASVPLAEPIRRQFHLVYRQARASEPDIRTLVELVSHDSGDSPVPAC